MSSTTNQIPDTLNLVGRARHVMNCIINMAEEDNISPEEEYKPLYNNRKVYEKAPMKTGEYLRLDEEIYW